MQINYKFWYITREDNGFITEAAIRFYEGDVTTEDEVIDGEITAVTKYRRINRLQEKDLAHLGEGFKKDISGNDNKIYTDKELGKIKSDKELVTFLNKELDKDTTRESLKI